LSLDYAQQHPDCLFSEALFAGLSQERTRLLPRPLRHEKDEFSLAWFSLGLTFLMLNLVILTSALSSPSFFSVIGPQALFELLVCLFACRFAWICPEMLLSSLVSIARPPARTSQITAPQVQLKKPTSLSSHLPPAGLRDAPTAFAHYAPDPRPFSVDGIRTNPRLSSSQTRQFRDVNSRFATLFREHRESLSPCPSPTFARRVPTFARRAPTILPTGKYRYSSRALPKPLKGSKQIVSRSKSRPSKTAPSKTKWKSTRTVRVGGSRSEPTGPRGWKSKRPSTLPSSPLRDAPSLPAHVDRPHIFAAVPNLDFSLHRESSTVQDKLQLLSQPRSSNSTQTLAPKKYRCFMMQQVRGEMVKAQARRDKQESSSEPRHFPLHPRPQ
jgi:hypothetical protein